MKVRDIHGLCQETVVVVSINIRRREELVVLLVGGVSSSSRVVHFYLRRPVVVPLIQIIIRYLSSSIFIHIDILALISLRTLCKV